MDKIIKFSLIVTFFNLENYISKCLESILNQSFTDFEIICIDDGSTDNTFAILQKFQQRDSRIKIIHQENQGVSAARNKGLSESNGEYIWFIDGDDYIELNALSEINKIIDKKPDIIHVEINYIDNYRKIPFGKNKAICKQTYPKIFFDNIYYFLNNVDIYNCGGNKIINHDFLKKYDISFDTKLTHGEDSLFIYQMLLNNPSICILGKQLYNYVRREDSVTHINRYEFIKKLEYMFIRFSEKYSYCKNDHIKIMNDYMLDFILNLLLSRWNDSYFSDYKREYLGILNRIENKYINNPSNYIGFRRLHKHLLLSKLHLSWLYWKVIRPIGKYYIVLPYRRIKNFLRRAQ